MNRLTDSFLKTIKTEFVADFISQEPGDLEAFGRDWTKVVAPCPSAIVFPRTTDEVSRFLKLCSTEKVAVVPSGGRTGLAGGAVAANGEVVLSLVRMTKMGEVDALAQTVRVQAGAVTEAVHRHCEEKGLTWPIDFASKGSSQVGGNISTNAGGVKVIHYGMTRNWVLGLQVVTMDGTVLELNGALEKNNTGMDLRQMFIGTEGTLGVITEATLKLVRVPRELNVFFFALTDIAAVFRLFLEARQAPFTLMAFETLTHNCLEIVCDHLKLKKPFDSNSGAYALVEFERPVSDSGREDLDRWLESLFEKQLVTDGVLAQSKREARELWSLREMIGEALFTAGLVHKNDIALPIAELKKFIDEMYQMYSQQYSTMEVYLFGHLGDGNLHVNTMKPDSMDQVEFLRQAKKVDHDLFTLVKKFNGSVSAEHGIGLLKKDALAFSRTPQEIEIFRQFKHIFDPQGLLNPGKIV